MVREIGGVQKLVGQGPSVLICTGKRMSVCMIPLTFRMALENPISYICICLRIIADFAGLSSFTDSGKHLNWVFCISFSTIRIGNEKLKT